MRVFTFYSIMLGGKGNCEFVPLTMYQTMRAYWAVETGFVHSVVCLTTGTQPVSKPVLHTVQSGASCFNLLHPLVS
jgi:hypothetical protein